MLWGADFIGILGPDTKYMLMNDPMWIDVAKYQDAAKLYNDIWIEITAN